MMLKEVATFELYVMLLTVMPLPASTGAAPSVTVANSPEEHTPAVTEPFAQ